MLMSDETQWYVMQGGEQSGPYSGEQMLEYATGGIIARESLVWADGMPEWVSAETIEGLFPAVSTPIQAVPPGARMTGSPAHQGQQPQSGSDLQYPHAGVKPASFALWIGMYLGGMALMMVGALLVANVASSVANSDGAAPAEITNAQAGGAGIGALVVMAGYFLTMLSFIPFYINVYRAWYCIQPGGFARSTPGKAIGFLFIPFFNFYWLFQAFKGLASDWNRTVSSYPDLRMAPKLSEGVFLAFCIGIFLFPLSLVMIFPVMSQICTGVNYFAFRPKPGQPGALGGLRLG
jgi:hypothetical protein